MRIKGIDFNPRSHERSDSVAQDECDRDSDHFNPRSHERSDPSHVGIVSWKLLISIHAPTRGATKGS